MVQESRRANLKKMVRMGGKPPPDYSKHTPFALFEWDCFLCRKEILHTNKAFLMIQDNSRRKKGFKPCVLWCCSDCKEKILDEFYEQEFNKKTKKEQFKEKEKEANLEFSFDDQDYEPVQHENHPLSWFVSEELKEAYLKIRSYVKTGLLSDIREDQLVKGREILDHACYFTKDIAEVNSVFYESSERPIELSSLTIPFDPDDKYMRGYFYLHPLAEDLIIYLEDQARKNGENILVQVTQDECKAPLCGAIYNITLQEFEKRERNNSLGDHFCYNCISAEGLLGMTRYSSSFCKTNKHSVILDNTRLLGERDPKGCHVCAQENSLSYGYNYQKLVSTTMYSVLKYGDIKSEGREYIVIDVIKSGVCNNYGLSCYLKGNDDSVPIDEHTTDFGECGLEDCKCFKGKITAQIETLRELKKYYDLKPLKNKK